MTSKKNNLTWKQKNLRPGEETQENVRRYLRHASRRKFPLDKNLHKNILRTLQLAYPKKENHHLIIQYLYFGKHISEKTLKPRYFRMTDKRMSDLLRMAAHKEKEMRLSWQYARLIKKEPQTQEERNQLLQTEKQLREAKGRIAMLTRADLLPLIHFVSQERYLEHQGGEDYQQKEAVEFFVDLADATLRACGMESVNRKFSIDYLLLSCFKENEMLTFSEILDQTGEIGKALQSD